MNAISGLPGKVKGRPGQVHFHPWLSGIVECRPGQFHFHPGLYTDVETGGILMQADRQETLSAIGEDLFTLAVDQPFRFPAAFTFVLRAFTTLEGIGRSLDPDFQFSEVAKPYASELLQLKVRSLSFIFQAPAYLSIILGLSPGRVAVAIAFLNLSVDFRLWKLIKLAEGLARTCFWSFVIHCTH